MPEGDYEALVRIMGYLMHVKDRTVTTDDMFQPLTETIELLKFYDMDIPEEVNVLLQVNVTNDMSIEIEIPGNMSNGVLEDTNSELDVN